MREGIVFTAAMLHQGQTGHMTDFECLIKLCGSLQYFNLFWLYFKSGSYLIEIRCNGS
jgi:hypothetical protein